MDIIKTFVIDETSHTIDILEHDGQRVFRADQIGKVIGLANVHQALASFGPSEKDTVRTPDTIGRQQNVTVLSEKGVYKLLFSSRKPIAEVFRNWVCDVLKNIAETGIYNLEQQVVKITAEKEHMVATLTAAMAAKDGDIQAAAVKLAAVRADLASAKSSADTVKAQALLETDIQRHNILVEAYKGKPVVYIGKILQEPGGSFIIKVGRSKFIETRTKNHSNKYGRQFLLLKCFETINNANFERFLLKHPDIVKYRHYGDIVGTERSSEAFLLTPPQLQKAINIATSNFKGFRETVEETRHKEIMRLLSHSSGAPSVTNVEKDNEDEDAEEDEDEDEEDQHMDEDNDDMDLDEASPVNTAAGPEKAVNKVSKKAPNRNNHSVMRARKVQRYSEDGVDLMQTYRTMGDCMAHLKAELGITECSKHGIDIASKRKTVMYGWRWHMAPRNAGDTEVFDIGETMERRTKTASNTVVCKMSEDMNFIMQMYESRKSVADALGFTKPTYVITSMNERRHIQGHRYLSLDDVSVDMVNDYLAGGGIVPLHKTRPDGIQVLQVHPTTDKTIRTWTSLDSIMREHKVGAKTLKLAIAGGTILRESIWKLA